MVAAALQRADGRWLLHRRPAHKQHGGLWEFPGGKVESGETPASALAREADEELGVIIDTDSIRPLAFAQDPPGQGRAAVVILLYSVGAWRGEPAALEAGAEIAWFLPDQIMALPKPPLDRDLCAQIFGSGMARDTAG